MSAFEDYRLKILHDRISFSFVKTAIPFYLGASLIDWIYVPDMWLEFLYVRIISCVCFGVLGFAVERKLVASQKFSLFATFFVTLVLGVGLGYMVAKTGGLESPYYAGLNWVGIGTLAFYPGRHIDRLIWILTTYLPVFVLCAVFGVLHFNKITALSAIFMGGTIALSLISNLLSTASLKTEVGLRGQLEALIRDKDYLIEKKSTEAANLKRLAKQFSPTVIHAIENHEISLNQRNRRNIGVLFIDVVGSTSRSNSLDHTDYQRALDIFFDFTIKRLLANNITVANFMGDGLMAISNAPYPTMNFETLALDVAIQILNETNEKQNILREFWHEHFHIRIGVSSGFANVGFFPNTDFGVYTAIGDSVNLAARLCQNSGSSAIATTKNIIKAGSDVLGNCSVTRGGSVGHLKGFSGYDEDFYLVIPPLAKTQEKREKTCPLCESQVIQTADLGDFIMYSCTKCQFKDLLPKVPNQAAS